MKKELENLKQDTRLQSYFLNTGEIKQEQIDSALNRLEDCQSVSRQISILDTQANNSIESVIEEQVVEEVTPATPSGEGFNF